MKKPVASDQTPQVEKRFGLRRTEDGIIMGNGTPRSLHQLRRNMTPPGMAPNDWGQVVRLPLPRTRRRP